jgi:hypothetical protein
MTYYTLLIHDIGTGWAPQWGSYSRAEVYAEREDYHYSQGIRLKDMRIVATDDTQEAINNFVRKLNEEQAA